MELNSTLFLHVFFNKLKFTSNTKEKKSAECAREQGADGDAVV